MKKTYLKSALATGIIASSIAVHGQAAGGAAGSAGAGTAAGGVSAGPAGGGTAVGGRAGVAPGVRAGAAGTQAGATRQLNTVGGSSIISPPATPPIGGASVIGTAPNTIGGSAAGNTILAAPGGGGTLGANATLPGADAALNPQAAATTALPTAVQNALQGFSVNGTLGSVSPVQTRNGVIYRASVVQNGQPVSLDIAQTGQILARNPVVGTAPAIGGNAGATTLNNAQAGLSMTALPQAVQNGIQSQIGANGQIQTISRDDLANGSVFRVTAVQNGVPTELRFGANGTLLSSGPLTGSATSTVIPTGGALLPGTAVVMDQLPGDIQTAIRSQLGSAHPNQITRMNGTDGMAYAIQYDQNGRSMLMTLSPEGRVVSNVPITGVGAAATRATGTSAATNSPAARGTNNSTRTSLRMEELPDSVQRALKDRAQYAEVRTVTRERRVGGDVYVIGVRGENNVGEITIDANGKVLLDNRRDFAELSVPKVDYDDERVTGIPFNTVPVAIQDAVNAYATASDIRSITLGTDRDGKAVYDVVFYRDGRRDRMIVAKDGTLRRIEQNVSPLIEVPDPKKAPVLAISDLPAAARDTIRRQTDTVLVKEIGTKKVGNENVYQVRYETNGSPVELLVSTDGRIVLPQDSPDLADSNAPTLAPVAGEDLEHAKVVNTAPATADTSAGAAASRELGTAISTSNSSEPAKVQLSDVPTPVQNTAKRLAGDSRIESITPKLSDTGLTYEISFDQNGTPKSIVVNKDGAVVSE